MFKDPLCAGTIALMNQLIGLGWEIYIYTTSYRPPSYVKRLFKFYSIKINRVINQEIHDKEVKSSFSDAPSKLPCKFGIDLHVDDDDSLRWNGNQHGFNTIIVKPNDIEWTQKVLDEAKRVMNLE